MHAQQIPPPSSLRRRTGITVSRPLAQVAVDISTSSAVFDAVKADLQVFFAANAGEYSGKFLNVANFAGDPLK